MHNLKQELKLIPQQIHQTLAVGSKLIKEGNKTKEDNHSLILQKLWMENLIESFKTVNLWHARLLKKRG